MITAVANLQQAQCELHVLWYFQASLTFGHGSQNPQVLLADCAKGRGSGEPVFRGTKGNPSE